MNGTAYLESVCIWLPRSAWQPLLTKLHSHAEHGNEKWEREMGTRNGNEKWEREILHNFTHICCNLGPVKADHSMYKKCTETY